MKVSKCKGIVEHARGLNARVLSKDLKQLAFTTVYCQIVDGTDIDIFVQ